LNAASSPGPGEYVSQTVSVTGACEALLITVLTVLAVVVAVLTEEAVVVAVAVDTAVDTEVTVVPDFIVAAYTPTPTMMITKTTMIAIIEVEIARLCEKFRFMSAVGRKVFYIRLRLKET